jgi:hypothetical protein
MHELPFSRRAFLRRSAFLAGSGALLPGYSFHINRARPRLSETILGQGEFRYRVEVDWGQLDPAATPVENCHEMVMDSRGRLILVTDHPRNNVLIYDKGGSLLDSWTLGYDAAHGLTHWEAGGEEFLFIAHNGFSDTGVVVRTTLDGRVVQTLPHPLEIGVYGAEDRYNPTETAIGPTGDIYVADGYGSHWILQFSPEGEFIRRFGGRGDADEQFQTPHGITIDYRDPAGPTLLITSRAHNAFKRFTLDGRYLSTIFLPGAFVCRPVLDGNTLYSGVCWSRLRYLNQTPNSGFVTILDRDDRVVSNLAGTPPEYRDGALQLMVQEVPVFKHCHDVCVDDEQNLYVCQWNADRSYPIKLHRER